jgi:hypothetical protein
MTDAEIIALARKMGVRIAMETHGELVAFFREAQRLAIARLEIVGYINDAGDLIPPGVYESMRSLDDIGGPVDYWPVYAKAEISATMQEGKPHGTWTIPDDFTASGTGGGQSGHGF